MQKDSSKSLPHRRRIRSSENTAWSTIVLQNNQYLKQNISKQNTMIRKVIHKKKKKEQIAAFQDSKYKVTQSGQ